MVLRSAVRPSLILMLAATLSVGLGACHTMLVSDYDDTFDQGLVTCQKDVASLLEKMIENTSGPDNNVSADTYSADADAYTKINVELDGLVTRAGAHANNMQSVDAVKHLQHSFQEFQTEAKAGSALHVAHIKDELKGFNDEFSAVMAIEILKKQGK